MRMWLFSTLIMQPAWRRHSQQLCSRCSPTHYTSHAWHTLSISLAMPSANLLFSWTAPCWVSPRCSSMLDHAREDTSASWQTSCQKKGSHAPKRLCNTLELLVLCSAVPRSALWTVQGVHRDGNRGKNFLHITIPWYNYNVPFFLYQLTLFALKIMNSLVRSK